MSFLRRWQLVGKMYWTQSRVGAGNGISSPRRSLCLFSTYTVLDLLRWDIETNALIRTHFMSKPGRIFHNYVS